MGGVTRIGRKVFTKEEGDEWLSRQTAPICIVRLDAKTAELLLFYIGHRHKKQERTPYPSAQDESNLDELFLRMLTEGLPQIDAFLYGAYPLYEAMIYREYAPQAVALSVSPWRDEPLVSFDAEAIRLQRFRLDIGSYTLGLDVAVVDVVDVVDVVEESGVQRVCVDMGRHQIALGVALKRRGISSAPKI